MSPVILAIDDEPPLLRLLRLELTSRGYEVVTADNGDVGLQLFNKHSPDLVLMDLRMPGMSPLELLRKLKSNSDVPIVILSARSEEQIRVEALEAGADEFISKPFVLEHLGASIEYLLAKGQGADMPSLIVTCGNDIEIDLRQRRVRRNGEELPLARSEWRLIEELATTPGEARLYQEILAKVWGSEYKDDTAFLRTVIDRISTKLGDDPAQPRIIVPFLKVGYILNCKLA